MFRNLRDKDTNALLRLGRSTHSAHGHVPASALAFDHVFRNADRVRSARTEELPSILDDYISYAQYLRKAALEHQPSKDAGVGKLLGLATTDSDDIRLWLESPIHEFLEPHRSHMPSIRSTTHYTLIREWELNPYLKDFLFTHLAQHLWTEADAWFRTPALNPCIAFIVYKYCGKSKCDRDHIALIDLTEDWYYLRLRVHLQQILILQTLDSWLYRDPQIKQRR